MEDTVYKLVIYIELRDLGLVAHEDWRSRELEERCIIVRRLRPHGGASHGNCIVRKCMIYLYYSTEYVNDLGLFVPCIHLHIRSTRWTHCHMVVSGGN